MDIERKFMEFYQDIGIIYDLDNLFVTLFATLYLSPKEIAMDELAKKTGYSLASVSNKIKTLEIYGMVKRITKPGSRKVFIFMEKNFIKLLKETIIKKHESVVIKAKKQIPRIIEEEKPKAKSEEDKKKIHILEDYFKQILIIEKLLQTMTGKLDELSK